MNGFILLLLFIPSSFGGIPLPFSPPTWYQTEAECVQAGATAKRSFTDVHVQFSCLPRGAPTGK